MTIGNSSTAQRSFRNFPKGCVTKSIVMNRWMTNYSNTLSLFSMSIKLFAKFPHIYINPSN